MKALITADTTETKEVKSLSIMETKHLKTKTKLSINLPEGITIAHVDLAKEVGALKAKGLDFTAVTLTAEGLKSFGALVNRSVMALSKMGIEIPPNAKGLFPLDWDDTAGAITVNAIGNPFTGNDFPFLVDLLTRLVRRANTAMTVTQHNLTLYDLRQAAGTIFDAKLGDTGLNDWINVREDNVKEDVKAAKAAIRKEKQEKARIERHKAAPKVKTGGKEKNVPKGTTAKPKAKPKPKAKAGTKETDLKAKIAAAKARHAAKKKTPKGTVPLTPVV